MLRTVAEETPRSAAVTRRDDATGSPVAMYSRTSASSTRLERSGDSIGTHHQGTANPLYKQQRHGLEEAGDRTGLLEVSLALPQHLFVPEERIGEARQVQHL